MRATDQSRPSSRRGASGAWNRLKPPREDALESYGLPSKGETRLNDFKTQEIYYNRIVERYMKFCAASPNGSDLDAHFASLSIQSTSLKSSTITTEEPQTIPDPPMANTSTGELAKILSALRKLREGITATARCDLFAKRAYIFNVHAAILCRDWESYHPALVTLLNKIHPQTPLTPAELHEYVGYLILDQACRQGDYTGAHETRLKYKYMDWRVQCVLQALVADNWVVFWKMKKAVDGYQRRIMGYAEQTIRVHALKCLGRGYMSADKRFIESCADRQWSDLVDDGVGWELTETDRVIIKKPKAK
ncbi:hypothetical protein BU24DRAFT_446536 [Aaosphaeria arxii CBS 175.79]|uniref:CSN8/PSMD8/EIF3K domain-containing protein n=1 Tax=Aaosphaeria arxii CBS 175.79 TaxID=1450172 RepID=A0A6A5Y9V8_9PLEO|nr:uncharacterized protein BU24DRAFT_446536 [Aaosphaeria arxii CBS 175.79]KAF2021541.1 hypothetical protein BU24DRAFT_446536 [Aaosphaeria arxii CBS 175.79]